MPPITESEVSGTPESAAVTAGGVIGLLEPPHWLIAARAAAKIIAYGAASYHGIDIAESAIAKGRAEHAGDAKVSFSVAAVADLPPLQADLAFSLGLLDWLRDDEIATIFAKSGSADFLHAIAERRPGIQQWLHRRYVELAYGYRTGSYRPRYLACDDIRAMADAVVQRPFYVYRNWQLSFGALTSSLPIDQARAPG